MPFTFSVNADSFIDNAQSIGQFAMSWNKSISYGFIRYHVPGTDGNLLTKMGATGQSFNIRAKVVAASVGAAIATYNNFMVAWGDTTNTLTDPNNETITRCQLDPNSMRIVQQPIACADGGGGAVQLQFEASFTSDAQES